MRRRDFIAGLGGAAAWPLAGRAQQALPVVGMLTSGARDPVRRDIEAAFLRGLSEAGYLEGRNVVIEYRPADLHLERLKALADDLVRRNVAVIYASPTAAVVAAKGATSSIPIVFAMGTDPVEIGLVGSLSRPGGNVTGIYFLAAPTVAKRLELLHELVPASTTIAYLANISDFESANAEQRELQRAARTLGLRLFVIDTSQADEFEGAFATAVREQAGGMVVGNQPLFFTNYNALIALSAHHRLPAIYAWREAAAAGGLASYNASLADANRIAGTYVGRILKGANPSDLPVQQATNVELIVNLKTAKALGLTFPLSMLGRADEVIE
jgi:putative ABC transport system substrate-binding protein